MKLPIYLDYSSTTPVDPRVAEKMMKYLTQDGIFGNPSSRIHRYAWQAEEAVDFSRNQIASLLGADSHEIIFTSGATESNNLAIKGVAQSYCEKGKHIITSITEHKSVLDTCKQLEYQGFEITRLIPKTNGLLSLEQINNAIRKDTILISIMHVNNETGVIQDIKEFGNLCYHHNIFFHVDATQSVGKLPINLSMLSIDLMSFSAHKLYGPKGIGGLYICKRKKINVKAQIHGGNQERGIRSGTLPVHQIVGMGEAFHLAGKEISEEMNRLYLLRNELWNNLQKIGEITLNVDLKHTIPTLLNVSFHNIDGELLLATLKDLAISSGSACTSYKTEPSYVLRALGIKDELAYSSIRFSLGRFTTKEEIRYAIIHIQIVVSRLRKLIPEWKHIWKNKF